MKVLCFIVLFMLAAVGPGWSQTGCLPHPDPNAVFLAKITININISGGSSSSVARKAGGKKSASGGCTIGSDACVWRTSTGQIEITIDPTSITFTGDCGSADDLDTKVLLNLLSQTAISQALARGFMTCVPDCATGTPTKVWTSSCVQRTGTGSNTRFINCDRTILCRRDYKVCCPYGPSSPMIQSIAPAAATTCNSSTGCQSTCP